MASELTEKAPWSLCQWLPTCSSCKCQDLSTSSRKQSYHLESRWRNFHYIGFAWPLTFSHLLGVLPSTFTTVYITTIELLNTLADYFSWMFLLHYPTLQKKNKDIWKARGSNLRDRAKCGIQVSVGNGAFFLDVLEDLPTPRAVNSKFTTIPEISGGKKKTTRISNCWMVQKSGRSPVDIWRIYHYLRGVLIHLMWWSPDFWTINNSLLRNKKESKRDITEIF